MLMQQNLSYSSCTSGWTRREVTCRIDSRSNLDQSLFLYEVFVCVRLSKSVRSKVGSLKFYARTVLKELADAQHEQFEMFQTGAQKTKLKMNRRPTVKM